MPKNLKILKQKTKRIKVVHNNLFKFIFLKVINFSKLVFFVKNNKKNCTTLLNF